LKDVNFLKIEELFSKKQRKDNGLKEHVWLLIVWLDSQIVIPLSYKLLLVVFLQTRYDFLEVIKFD